MSGAADPDPDNSDRRRARLCSPHLEDTTMTTASGSLWEISDTFEGLVALAWTTSIDPLTLGSNVARAFSKCGT
jgi:hypothetical protein